MATAPAKRLKFPLRLLFPHDKPFSGLLIGLLLATDDVRHLRKLLITKPDYGSEASESERAIVNGELGHVFRLMCSHLYEAMDAFTRFDDRYRSLLDEAAIDDRARDALAKVRQARSTIWPGQGRRSFIDIVRNLVGFHYIEQKLRKTLDEHEGRLDQQGRPHLEGTLVLSPFQGFGRYTVADRLVTLLISDEIGVNLDDFPQRYMHEIGEAINLVGALADVVDYLIGYLLAKRLDQIEQHEEEIPIDPDIERAREEVERARRGDVGQR